jgi:hypothetical protein
MVTFRRGQCDFISRLIEWTGIYRDVIIIVFEFYPRDVGCTRPDKCLSDMTTDKMHWTVCDLVFCCNICQPQCDFEGCKRRKLELVDHI